MLESVNKEIFELPVTLSVLGDLPLKGKLRGLFSLFAGEDVVLLDEQGRWVSARVNAGVTFSSEKQRVALER